MPNVTWSQLSRWLFSSLSLSLSLCGIVGDRLPCSDAQSQAAVSGRNQWFFKTLEGAHNWQQCIFCHLKAPMDSPLLFQTKVSLGMLCFFLSQAACLCHLIASYITVYDKSLLIVYCSQHLCKCDDGPHAEKGWKERRWEGDDYSGS